MKLMRCVRKCCHGKLWLQGAVVDAEALEAYGPIPPHFEELKGLDDGTDEARAESCRNFLRAKGVSFHRKLGLEKLQALVDAVQEKEADPLA